MLTTENLWAMFVSLENVSRKGFWEGKVELKVDPHIFSYILSKLLRLHGKFLQVAWHSMTPLEMYGALDMFCRFLEQNCSDLPGND